MSPDGYLCFLAVVIKCFKYMVNVVGNKLLLNYIYLHLKNKKIYMYDYSFFSMNKVNDNEVFYLKKAISIIDDDFKKLKENYKAMTNGRWLVFLMEY